MFKKLLLIFPIVCLGSVKNNLNSIERKELQESNSFIENKASSSVIDTTKNKKDFHFSGTVDSKKYSVYLFFGNFCLLKFLL